MSQNNSAEGKKLRRNQRSSRKAQFWEDYLELHPELKEPAEDEDSDGDTKTSERIQP